MKKGILWLIVIVVIIFVVSMLVRSGGGTPAQPTASSPDSPAPAPTSTDQVPAPADQVSTSTSADPSANVKEFTVTGGDFFFAPKTLTVKKGDTVKITLVNSDGTHDLRIDEFKAATPRIRTGAQATVTFVADKAGSFQYYCSVGDHRAMGMWGTLTVTP